MSATSGNSSCPGLIIGSSLLSLTIVFIQFRIAKRRFETDFTGTREGFVQRQTGVNEKGRQVVAVYWSTKAASDASLNPFMAAPIAKDFMQDMDGSTVAMGRYELLK